MVCSGGGGFRSELGSGLLVVCSGEEGSKVCWEVDCWWCAVGGRVQKCAGEWTVDGVQREVQK